MDARANAIFKNKVKLIYDEYNIALETGIYPDENFDKETELNVHFFNKKCQIFYQKKVASLASEIIKSYKLKYQEIDLVNDTEFRNLVDEACYKPSYFFQEK